ncbi:MAG: hypothetical protein ACRDPO_23760, partial [Streptosporangiaceae bacterium]
VHVAFDPYWQVARTVPCRRQRHQPHQRHPSTEHLEGPWIARASRTTAPRARAAARSCATPGSRGRGGGPRRGGHHLGDLTGDGLAAEFEHVGPVFDDLDQNRVAYSVLAGNHDINSGTDDQRGPTPDLGTMGPQRSRDAPSFVGCDNGGYNTAHKFTAAGREWLVLALDWRCSAEGFARASQVIKDHPKTPVILTTHEIATPTYSDDVFPYQYGDPENDAELSSYGQQVWDNLINDNDQIFLTLNGHYWPPGRTTLKNAQGNDVRVHITNYQNRYYGGAEMIRLYHFDLGRNTIDVETIAPWILDQPEAERNALAARESRITTPTDYFSMSIDFRQRFSGFDPVRTRPARPARKMLIPGTLACWRFDHGGADGSPFTAGRAVADRTGHGNDFSSLVTVPGSAGNVLTWARACRRTTGGTWPWSTTAARP